MSEDMTQDDITNLIKGNDAKRRDVNDAINQGIDAALMDVPEDQRERVRKLAMEKVKQKLQEKGL